MENKPKHTPGPWTAEQDGNIYDIKSGGFTPCTTNVIDAETDAANAALIAAAPELLEACQAIMKAEAMQQGKRDGGTMGAISIAIDAARAAIAKAEGK